MDRFRSIEVLLRTIAFSEALESYDGNLAGFLNSYMLKCMKLSSDERTHLESKLGFMASVAETLLGRMNSAKKSLTFVEGILVGTLAAHSKLSEIPADQLKARIIDLGSTYPKLPALVDGARYGLASAAPVKRRLGEAIALFASA